MAVSSLLFAAGHLYQGLFAFVFALVQGVFLAMVFVRARNLHVTALAHAAYNFSVLVLTLLPSNGLSNAVGK